MKNTRRPGGGRKPAKPEYSKEKNLKEQLNVAVELYKKGMSLKAIGDELLLNPIKVRKLLITAEVYKSEIAEKVKSTFDEWESSGRELHKTPVSLERQGLLRLLPKIDEISCSQETWPLV